MIIQHYFSALSILYLHSSLDILLNCREIAPTTIETKAHYNRSRLSFNSPLRRKTTDKSETERTRTSDVHIKPKRTRHHCRMRSFLYALSFYDFSLLSYNFKTLSVHYNDIYSSLDALLTKVLSRDRIYCVVISSLYCNLS